MNSTHRPPMISIFWLPNRTILKTRDEGNPSTFGTYLQKFHCILQATTQAQTHIASLPDWSASAALRQLLSRSWKTAPSAAAATEARSRLAKWPIVMLITVIKTRKCSFHMSTH